MNKSYQLQPAEMGSEGILYNEREGGSRKQK